MTTSSLRVALLALAMMGGAAQSAEVSKVRGWRRGAASRYPGHDCWQLFNNRLERSRRERVTKALDKNFLRIAGIKRAFPQSS